jgi:hypothetical protein
VKISQKTGVKALQWCVLVVAVVVADGIAISLLLLILYCY